MMKASKSRTVVGRTFAKVKSRISSISSVASQDHDKSVSSLTAAPPPHAGPQPLDGMQETGPLERRGEGQVPQISTLSITPSTWTIFANPSYPRFAATAYVQFTLTCKPQNAAWDRAEEQQGTSMLLNVPGVLLQLSLDMNISGTHTIIQDFTQYSMHRLEPEGTWICLVHLGFNESTLASKLAASWNSLRTRTSKSLKRYNMETIDRWLEILSSDQERERMKNGLISHEDVTVRIKVRYQHSFLPNGDGGTWLEDRAECRVNLTDSVSRGSGDKLDGVADGEAFGRDSRGATCDVGEEDMMEEMVREYNVVVGPPFML